MPDGARLDLATEERIAKEVVTAAERIIRGKGATNYAVGLAATRVIEAILRDENGVLPVSSLIDGRYGLSDVCLSLPSLVNKAGSRPCSTCRCPTRSSSCSRSRPRRSARSPPPSACRAAAAMLDLLAASPLLTIMIVVALGTLLGIVPFGPVKFGPAGALFVGLAVGALDPRLGQGLGLIQTLGLALFVYTVGLASGATFFSSLRRQLPLMLERDRGAGHRRRARSLVVGGVLGLTSALAGRGVRGVADQHPDPGRGDREGRPARNRRSGTR